MNDDTEIKIYKADQSENMSMRGSVKKERVKRRGREQARVAPRI